MKVPANDFHRQWQETRQATLDAVDAVGQSGWYVLGAEVEAFEKELAARCGVTLAIGVASGLDAIEIALRVAGCQPGSPVLTTPVSAFATTLAILRIGAKPVFCDVDSHGLIDLDLCEALLESRPDIRFFVPVHLYGHCLDLGRLAALRQKFGIVIIEDCAQSIGASHRGRPAGATGDLAATSFYPTKNLGALGDGGAILTSRGEFAAQCRALRDYGQSAKYRHDVVGYNSRLDELHAAILRRAHLPRLDAWTVRRGQIARMYQQGIQNQAIEVPGSPSGSESCWHLFPVFVDPARKPAFMLHLRSAGVGPGEHYPLAITEQSALPPGGFESTGQLANAITICRSEVSLPIHPYLTDSDVEWVIGACNGWGG